MKHEERSDDEEETEMSDLHRALLLLWWFNGESAPPAVYLQHTYIFFMCWRKIHSIHSSFLLLIFWSNFSYFLLETWWESCRRGCPDLNPAALKWIQQDGSESEKQQVIWEMICKNKQQDVPSVWHSPERQQSDAKTHHVVHHVTPLWLRSCSGLEQHHGLRSSWLHW